MDAHVFRLLAGATAAFLGGARLEKISAPDPETAVFAFSPAGQRLILLSGAREPFLFFSSRLPAALEAPSARRLSKEAAGRRLGRGVLDFSRRSLAFPLLEGESVVRYLFLDLRRGPEILPFLPEGFGREPAWPDAALRERLRQTKESGGDEDSWRLSAVLTPLLRETLAALDPLEGAALMVDLEAGGHSLHVYGDALGKPVFLSAWRLPESVAAGRGLFPLGREQETPSPEAILAWAARVGENLLSSRQAAFAAREEAREKARSAKRLRRRLQRLEREERRLGGLLALREDARLLQAQLWRFAPEERRSEVLLAEEEGLCPRRILLDPLLSVRENMQRMFRHSAGGARGLAALRERRRALASPGPQAGGRASLPDFPPLPPYPGAWEEERPLPSPKDLAAGPGRKGQTALKDIAGFSSSDGYLLLRGKNARGNRLLLSLGRPHDLWLHLRDGPSAHLLIRRAHAKDEVPEQTLREAAVLVGLKSRQRRAGKAEVMVALFRHVHAVKGAAPGTARVERELPGITVSFPPEEG
jgi:hypothetical protein